MASNRARSLFPFGAKSVFSQPDPLMGIFYGMGFPIFSRAAGGYTSIYRDRFNDNLTHGRDPFAGFPERFRSSGAGGSGDGSQNNPIRNMPQWWQDWYNSQGRYGGPQVEGLL